ncbi:hypothetical protein P8C59_008698 [Phyllachora maydis]|uniref:Uncharacterized protein n=1 Tax=Phyllachora maydis TaxID=1825666 RepID=A0AAD9IAZ4_9PEZI|nr:hypothetical protein P8C59_008698 [Phyllachora maydis]
MAGRQDDLQQHVLEAAANAQQRVSMPGHALFHLKLESLHPATEMYAERCTSRTHRKGVWRYSYGGLIRRLCKPVLCRAQKTAENDAFMSRNHGYL